MSSNGARKSFEYQKVLKYVTRLWKLKKESHSGFWANG